MEQDVFQMVDILINYPVHFCGGSVVFSERRGGYIYWNQVAALEEKVEEWSKEHPVLWNVGIGATASFVPTLTRLLFDRTKDLYGPYDHVIHVRLPSPSAMELANASSNTTYTTAEQQRRLAFEVLTELASTLLTLDLETPQQDMMMINKHKQLQELKRLASEESYFGYRTISHNLMLQAFGQRYMDFFAPSDRSIWGNPVYQDQPYRYPLLDMVREQLQGKGHMSIWRYPVDQDQPYRQEMVREQLQAAKRHLLLVENLHAPVSLDFLVLAMGEWRPSVLYNRRWLISTTSKDVCEKSRDTRGVDDWELHLAQQYYHALPFHDLSHRDWALLIKEALQDAARSCSVALPDKGDDKFWLLVAQHCLYYSILYHHRPLRHRRGAAAAADDDECQPTETSNISICSPVITSDELVRCWVAEDLIFSTASPTQIPAATGQKQSNYYRSAFEAGKVLIQALQQYSLLPTFSASTSTVTSTSSEERTTSASSSSSQDLDQDVVVTGVSKLAQNVPRLRQDELHTHVVKSNQLRWVSFMNDDGRHISWNWYPRQTTRDINMMTSLILRGCSDVSAFPLDKLLTPHLRVIDLSYTPIDSLPPSFSNLLNLYLLSLRGCSQLQTLSPPPPPHNSDKQTSPLAHLENLEVLDMNGVPLLELTQQDCCNKRNLHYLDLTGSKLTTLPTEFFRDMSSLEELILGSCSNLKKLPPSIALLSNLLVLHVEGTQIISLPYDMFRQMQNLHTLKLINNVLLKSLPMSLSEAKGLQVLHLYNCISLESLPSTFSKAKGPKELHISNCISLSLQALWELLSFLENLYIQAWEGLEDIVILGHPNLKTFSLSGPWVRSLFLRGCSMLKSVDFNDDLVALEHVDLSGTAIEEVPHNLPNLPQLSMLLLLGVPCFKRFPWHQLVRFPKVFYLDHSANDDYQIPKMLCQPTSPGAENQQEEETSNTAQLNIDDPRMFYSFNADAVNKLVNEGQFLQSFTITVNPCHVKGKEPLSNKVEQHTRIQRCSTYRDVQYSEVESIVPMMKLQPKQRHVEISAKNQYPSGLRHILSVTNSLFITDDDFITCLTDLNYSLISLEECQLQCCDQMAVVFMMSSNGLEALPSLKTLQASCLKNLLSLVEPSDLSYSNLITLNMLKHIHLEHCPRLEKLFPCSLSLPALETLVILFCSNLKTIFYKQPDYKVAHSPLPNIKRIYLQELPQMLHMHDDALFQFETLKWEKLFVRGCRSFRRLPLLKKEYPKPKVEVSGEREWWDRLQLKLPEQSDYYLHMAPPKFVSRKKHIIESYLR